MALKKAFYGLIGILVAFCLVLSLKIPALGLSTVEFCGSCHVMEEQVDTFVHSAHQIATDCGDCHVPHELVYGAFDKAYTGTKDLIGVILDKDPFEIHAGKHSKNVVQANCVRCHQDFLNEVGNTMDEGGRYCFDCHKNTPHARKPNIEEKKLGDVFLSDGDINAYRYEAGV